MIEVIYDREGEKIALFCPGLQNRQDAVDFVSDSNDELQVGIMNRPKGYVIKPHAHNIVNRKLNYTTEVLVILAGVLKTMFFDGKNEFIREIILREGDVLLLFKGAHGFEIVEDVRMLEIKQGPYQGLNDKVFL